MSSDRDLPLDRRRIVAAPENGIASPADDETAALTIEAVVRQLAVALVVTDIEHRIRIWSAGAESLLGYTAEEIIGKPHRLLVPDDVFESDERELRRRVLTSEKVFYFTTERLAKDGRRIPVGVCRSVVRNRSGEPFAYSSVILDQTEKRGIHDQLIQAERLTALVRVVGKVFHELRTPLGVLVLQAEILAEEIEELIHAFGPPADPDRIGKVRASLGLFLREIQRIENIGEDYLLMIRPIQPRRSDLPLGEFLDTIGSELEAKSDRSDYEVRVRSPNREARVSLDLFQMLRVFHNLAANSLDAILDTTTPILTLDAAIEGDRLVIVFRDNGPGLAPELKDGGAFEIFTTTKRTGSGLGLHLVQEIVLAHGGKITLQDHPEGGVEARIVLPREEPRRDA